MLADPAGSKKALNELIAARDEAVAATKAFGDVKAKADELDQRAATLTGSETSSAERPRSCRRAVTGLAVHSRFRSALQMLRLFQYRLGPYREGPGCARTVGGWPSVAIFFRGVVAALVLNSGRDGGRHHGLGGLAQPSFRSASQDPVLLGRGMTFVAEHEFLVY